MASLQGLDRQAHLPSAPVRCPFRGAQRLRSSRQTSCKAVAARLNLKRRGCRELAVAVKPLPGRRATALCCRVSALPDQPEPVSPPTTQLGSTLYLGVLFLGWYGFNILFNLANKTVLKVVPLPFTCTTVQLATGSLMSLAMWALNLHERPKINKDLLLSVLPLAIVHTLGNLLTNVSLGKVAVSFTHTIKATEPFFTVLLSAMFLGDTPSPAVLATLVPIVGGVAAASFSEATFNWPGFLAAMGSNATFQSRNVFSKKFMGKGKNSLDNINLFSLITIMSFFLMVPFSLAREGFHFTPGALRAMGVANPTFILQQIFYAAVSFHTYQQVSYMILERVSPVTHSIGNCLKRVVVIVASILFFKNPMPQQNIIGTSIALVGVFAYSQVKRRAGKKATTVKPAV